MPLPIVADAIPQPLPCISTISDPIATAATKRNTSALRIPNTIIRQWDSIPIVRIATKTQAWIGTPPEKVSTIASSHWWEVINWNVKNVIKMTITAKNSLPNVPLATAAKSQRELCRYLPTIPALQSSVVANVILHTHGKA